MTAAHRLPGVLMRRCRGARAVATFSGGVESRNAPARIAPATPCRSLGVERPDAQPEPPRAQSRSSARPAESTFPGNGARGPGVAAFKSTAAAPVFNSASNVHGALFARRAFINASRLLRE